MPFSAYFGLLGVGCVQQMLQHVERDQRGLLLLLDDGGDDMAVQVQLVAIAFEASSPPPSSIVHEHV